MKKKVGFWPQVALIFFIVSGGAYGIEPLVHEVGTLWALILILIMPILWAAPIAAMVAELSSAMPEAGGYYVWVRRGLGRYWGFQEGWWTLCYSAVDLAVYPVLFVTYLCFFFPILNSDEPNIQMIRWGICAAFIIGSLIFNLIGIRVVGINALLSLIFVVGPFAVLTIAGIFSGSWKNVIMALNPDNQVTIGFTQIAAGLAIILWNYCGWDNVSTYAHEVQNPEKNYPKTLLTAMTIIVFSYLLPMLAGYKMTLDPEVWNVGWPSIASLMGGQIFGLIIAAAALLSAWALFNTQLLYISRLPMAMAHDQLLPKILGKTSLKTGVPYVALLIMAILAIGFTRLSFSKLMIVDILFYTLGISLEFVTLIVLRNKEPQMKRPYRIPLNGLGLSIMALSPIALATIIALFSTMGPEGSFEQVQIVFGGVVLGLLLGLRIKD